MLTLPESEENIMDIYPAFVLLQHGLKNKDVFIIGIAEGKEEAYKVFEEIVMDCYEKSGTFKLKDVLTEFR